MQKTNSSPDDTWTIAKLLAWLKNYFEEKEIESPRLSSELLICKVLECSRVSLYTNFDKPLSKEELARLKSFIKRRLGFEPVAYIIGEKSFFEFDLMVNKNVLIPRPDTEKLIEAVSEKYIDKKNESLNIIDIGTGSGAIALSLAHIFKKSHITATDISIAALETAKENARKNCLDDRVLFLKSNWFDSVDENSNFDIIVSNPPYIRTKDINRLQPEVRDHEPKLALDGGDDGLDCYRLLISEIPEFLKDDGLVFFEIGFDQADDIINLCENSPTLKVIEIMKDYGNRDRVAVLKKREN